MEAKIYSALCTTMADISAIGKKRKNDKQGYAFRGIDDVYNSLQPALIKNRVFVVPEVIEQAREERKTQNGGILIYSILKVKFSFYADDGSNVSATVVGEGMDIGDKASNKAMSAAFKYACFEVLCIPTEEMKDPDAETPNNGEQEISIEQIDELVAEIQRTGSDPNSMLAYINQKFRCEVKSVDGLLVKHFECIMPKLKKKPDRVLANG